MKSLLPCHFKIRNVCPYFDKNVKHFNSNSGNKNRTSFDSFVEKIKHFKFDNLKKIIVITSFFRTGI